MAQDALEKTTPTAVEPEPDFSPRITSPYLIGVYLAMNAIPDAYLFLDGPSCFPLKSPSIQGNHDWFSDLSNVSGHQRCVTTQLHPSTVVFNRDALFMDTLQEIARYERCGGIFMSARPMAAITSLDYERTVSRAREQLGMPVMLVPPNSLASNWLGGYAEAMHALAKGIDLTGAAPKAGKVAVVGYLWDRNEGDHLANQRELERMLGALGLELEVMWLSGRNFDELAKVRDCSAIISMPYGRKAAKVLADRLDIPLVETMLPMGFGGSELFLRTVAEALGKVDEAQAFIDAELREWVPKLEWVIPFVFQSAKVGFIGDPHHVGGFADMLDMLGAEMSFAYVSGTKNNLEALPPFVPEDFVKFEPTQRFLADFIPQQISEEGLDLLVSSNVGMKLGNVPIMEFGYPSYFTHRLVDRPFLGFRGSVAVIETMANTIRHQQFY